MKYLMIVYFLTIGALAWFSYGFLDPNLTLSTNPLFTRIQAPLSNLVYHNRPLATTVFLLILLGLFYSYAKFLQVADKLFISWRRLFLLLFASSTILVLSYPALSYDLFNYITTAKVTFTYHENPYIVMPTEIPNEPYLAFTRAANKVALYGPVWLLLTVVPYTLGNDQIWQTIITFKIMNALVYICFSYFIYKVTKNIKNVLFFAFNPLILIEVLVSGHNDIYMMILALGGLYLWQNNRISVKVTGLVFFILSWFVKGSTLVLLPLIFMKKLPWEKLLFLAYYLLLIVFIVVAPLREELYPWYAVWLISVASFMDFKKQTFIVGFTIVLSFALELRHLPYMWMGYYEAPGPIFRLLLTVIPLAFYGIYLAVKRARKQTV